MTRITAIVVALIATVLMMTFVLGLSHSISTGFAGFWGGFPFMVIALFVIALALYDLWEETIKNKN